MSSSDTWYQVKGREPVAKSPICFRLPESADADLKQIAGELGKSAPELAKQILIEFLEKY